MARLSHRTILGVRAARPRPTPAALRLALLRLVLPAALVLLAFDIAVWALARALFGVCIGLWCWL
jgi:hypothetical protein